MSPKPLGQTRLHVQPAILIAIRVSVSVAMASSSSGTFTKSALRMRRMRLEARLTSPGAEITELFTPGRRSPIGEDLPGHIVARVDALGLGSIGKRGQPVGPTGGCEAGSRKVTSVTTWVDGNRPELVLEARTEGRLGRLCPKLSSLMSFQPAVP